MDRLVVNGNTCGICKHCDKKTLDYGICHNQPGGRINVVGLRQSVCDKFSVTDEEKEV